MKDAEIMKPILFSTEMVKAILAGKKTQTRRTLTPQYETESKIGTGIYNPTLIDRNGDIYPGPDTFGAICDDGEFCIKSKYGQQGDILWVRETWQHGDRPDCPMYKAGGDGWEDFVKENPKFKWKPSIFMPKDYCRLFLKIKSIRVERLQDITPGDAVDEGIEYWNIDSDALKGGELVADFKNYTWKDDPKNPVYDYPSYASCIESYKSLWQSINGEQSWNDNPFVWVIEFENLLNL